MNTAKGLPAGWEVRQGLNGRLYYHSKQSQTVQILPPPEVWRCAHNLPYGWEMAIDYENRNYYVNHITQTVTYEDPRTEEDQTSPNEMSPAPSALLSPQPRECEILRDPAMGFGFIAGSEKPVIIRSVTAGGPSEGKLLPDDQIIKIGSENVMMADRERVIELIRVKSDSVVLTVLQPNRSASSSFLNPAKKTFRTMDRPKVRFADDVVINGQERTEGSSPLLVSPGVLRVELENKQTRSFRFQTETTAGDAVAAICDKLGFKDPNLFSLVLTPPGDMEKPDGKGAKSFFRVSTASGSPSFSGASPDSLLIAPWDCLAKVVSNPLVRHHSCFFRLEFMPKDFHKLARNDPNAFQYLYQQCINDVVSGDAYKEDLTREELVKLAVIQIQELVLTAMPSTPPDKVQKRSSSSSEIPPQRNAFRFSGIGNKLTLKYIEKEYGLKRFLPPSILSIMQKDNPTARSIRKSLQQYLKASYSTSFFSQHPTSPIIPTSPILTSGGNADAAIFQLRLQYLKILSPQHLFGGRYFSASMQALMESDITILVGHNYGISQMINAKTRMVSVLAEFQHVTGFEVAPCQASASTTTVRIEFAEKKELLLTMEPQAAHNFAFMVAGYCRVYGNIDMVLTLPVAGSTTAPMYFGPHKVKPSHWNYPPVGSTNGVATDTPLSNDLATASPSYFYCDFSEPITPAVLCQETPDLHVPKKNGFQRPPTPPPVLNYPIDEEDEEDDDDDILVFYDHKTDTSDTNNNHSFRTDAHDVTYEEIHSSLPESPVSSLSVGQYSDLSPSNSLPNARDEIVASNGYLVPTPPEQRQRKTMAEKDGVKRVESDGDNDWMDLMEVLGKDKTESNAKDVVDGSKMKESKDTTDLPSSQPPVKNDKDAVQEIVVPSPPNYPPPKRKESVRREGDELVEKSKSLDPKNLFGDSNTFKTTETSKKSATVDTRTAVLTEQSPHSPHMSSFKPSEAELNVFALTRNDPRTASPNKPSSVGGTPEIKSLGSMDDVQDPATRKKLQETEDLIEYFRRRREEVVGPPSADDGSNKPGSNFDSSIEFDSPIVVSDIAAGNKRLRKAEKAASKNRKSWAASETLSGKFSLEDQGPISISNPDLASSNSMPKKRSKSLFRRLFGDRRRRSRSMYETGGTSSAYGRRKKRFRIPKFRFRRAPKKDNRKPAVQVTEEETPSKTNHFRFRPFSNTKKEPKSPGVLVISEPCDDVRGIDLLPSGKYTVAGTMFQANGDARETEIITLESNRPSRENLADPNGSSEANDDSKASDVKRRTSSSRDSQRPVSFSTFQQALLEGYAEFSEPKLTTVNETVGNSLPNGLEQASPCELSLTESSEALQEILDERAKRSQNGNSDLAAVKLLRQNKTPRKLLPVENPIVPTTMVQKTTSLPPDAHLNSREPQATSTPIQNPEKKGIKKRPSQKRPAPPPPVVKRVEEPIGMTEQKFWRIDKIDENDSKTDGDDSKSDWGEDSLFKRNSVESPSLVTEIMSYLDGSNAATAEADKLNTAENDVLEEPALPYDEGYMMPGIKSAEDVQDGVAVQTQDEYENVTDDEKRQRTMYEMFYDEMMADDSRLALNPESPDPSEQEDELDSDDSENHGPNFGSYDVTYENDIPDAQATTDHNEEGESIVLKSYGEIESGRSNWTSDDNRSMTLSANEGSDVSAPKDDSATSGTESSYVNVQKRESKNVPSKLGLKNQSSSGYVTYQNLISPSGFNKVFPGAKRTSFTKKPPLPPKPIFH